MLFTLHTISSFFILQRIRYNYNTLYTLHTISFFQHYSILDKIFTVRNDRIYYDNMQTFFKVRAKCKQTKWDKRTLRG